MYKFKRSDLSQQGSHLQSQFLVDGEVTRHNGLICLISQQQPLPLRLPPDLEREVQPGDGKVRAGKEERRMERGWK